MKPHQCIGRGSTDGWEHLTQWINSTEAQSGWSVAPAREEIALLRLLGGESNNVISETNGRVSTTELT